MKSDANQARYHLDKRLGTVEANAWTPPQKGWVRAIRESLGMTLAQLAQRLGNSKQWVLKAEKQEIQKTLTLATLERLAHALNCQLVYTLIPNDSLQAQVEHQAKAKAKQLLRVTHHTMGLENQDLPSDALTVQEEQLIRELLNGNLSRLWDSHD